VDSRLASGHHPRVSIDAEFTFDRKGHGKSAEESFPMETKGPTVARLPDREAADHHAVWRHADQFTRDQVTEFVDRYGDVDRWNPEQGTDRRKEHPGDRAGDQPDDNTGPSGTRSGQVLLKIENGSFRHSSVKG